MAKNKWVTGVVTLLIGATNLLNNLNLPTMGMDKPKLTKDSYGNGFASFRLFKVINETKAFNLELK